MLDLLERAVAGDQTRRECAKGARAKALAFCRGLPLVRRIARDGSAARGDASPWFSALSDRRLEPHAPETTTEEAIGIQRSLYFYLGAPAYPKGAVAFVCNTDAALRCGSSFWPFDTGAAIKGYARPKSASAWLEPQWSEFLRRHWGAGSDLKAFAAEYLAAHFFEPAEYVRRAQQSAPDFPPYHDLESRDGDRRAWTIEVQVHEPLNLEPEAENLLRIVVARPQLLDDIPDDLSSYAVVDTDIAARVCALIEECCTQEAA